MTPFPILSCVDRIYVINLASRSDRRRGAESQLARLGLGFEHPAVTLFPAVRPAAAEGFSSVGARGCFLSHLGVLKDAAVRNVGSILLLEDDADFTARLVGLGEADAATIAESSWEIFYLGYDLRDAGAEGRGALFRPIAPTTPVLLAHAVMFRRAAIDGLVEYLEKMLARPPGDPEGGPMHVDGAYGWYRRANAEITTVVAADVWAVQRASRTDIHGSGWKNRIPFIDTARRLRNLLRAD